MCNEDDVVLKNEETLHDCCERYGIYKYFIVYNAITSTATVYEEELKRSNWLFTTTTRGVLCIFNSYLNKCLVDVFKRHLGDNCFN